MSLSQILLGLLVIIFISFTILYFLLDKTRPKLLNTLTPNTGPMTGPIKLGNTSDGRDKFLVPPGASLMVYIKCYVNNKTPSIGNSDQPINILQVGDSVRLQLLSGGVSMNPKTRLIIRTQNPDINTPYEEFDIPQFPQQKWVHLVIVREGRRYTLYYNGKIVASVRTQYFPSIDSSSIQVGDSKLIGEFAIPKVAPTPFHSEEVISELTGTSDTRYEPYKSINLSGFFNIGCPNGLFCFTTNGFPKENPLKVWETPYA